MEERRHDYGVRVCLLLQQYFTSLFEDPGVMGTSPTATPRIGLGRGAQPWNPLAYNVEPESSWINLLVPEYELLLEQEHSPLELVEPPREREEDVVGG